MRFSKYLTIFLILIWFSSCKVFRSNLMLKTPKDYTYDKIVDSVSEQNYKIEANAILTLRIFANDGFKLIDIASSATNSNLKFEVEYLVDPQGYCKLPLLNRVKLKGLTINDAQDYLEKLYSDFYVKPFVNLKIINKRVIVFPGNGGDAQVLYLTNNNTTVIESLALAGGIREDGKAYKVKLIRNEGGAKPKVYLMDLSKIEGLTAASSVVLANDIIYVEPRYRLARTLVAEITPIVSLITSTILIYTLFVRK